MTEHVLFETVDPVALERASSELSSAFMLGAASILHQLAHDDTIPPDALASGICKAHLDGAAAVMAQACYGIGGVGTIVADATDYLAKAIAEMLERQAAEDRAAAYINRARPAASNDQ